MLERDLARNVAVICNPNSGTKDGSRQLDQTLGHLQKFSGRVELFNTSGPGDATTLASKVAADGYTLVFAAGGDGTLNEVAKGLIGTEAVLGQIPMGTVNIWACEVGIPKNPVKAVDLVLNGRVHLMDTGEVNGHPFLLMAGIGFDGEFVGRVQQPGKAKVKKGQLQYMIKAARTLADYSGPAARLTINEGVFDTKHLLQTWISNTQQLAFFKLIPQAKADDGKFYVSVVAGKRGEWVPAAFSSFLRRQTNCTYFGSADELSIDLSRPMRFQYDGEPGETTDHIESKLIPQSLKVLVVNRELPVFSRRPLYQ